MTKILSMVSHKNYNLNANEGFVIFLTSKLIKYFIDYFTSKMKSQSICLFTPRKYKYKLDFGPLQMKCTQYG